MAWKYSIHPSIGIAREGNSPDQFYLAPEKIGGLPIECDAWGNELRSEDGPRFVERFKDPTGRIKRQAARFRILKFDDANPADLGVEVTLADDDVEQIAWTVHPANKKAIWYNFSELEGDLMLGEWKPDGTNTNSYTAQHVGVRNSGVSGDDRKKLIIDPGPRTLKARTRTGANRKKVEFSRHNIPRNYKWGSFPEAKIDQGFEIDTLGEMLTDSQGRLLVLGGFGRAGGSQSITSFAGADSWHDDISDGPVTCQLTLKGGKVIEMDAWVVIGSPKFAPELVNIVTLDDLMFDVGVRYLNLVPTLYNDGWNAEYVANYKRDIEPLIKRPMDCLWVANVPSMAAFAAPPFDTRDASEENRAKREAYFSFFRRPEWTPDSQQNQLMSEPLNNGIPLMPLNSGSNSVGQVQRNHTTVSPLVDKFLTLTETQYFLLGQWAKGKFTTESPDPLPGIHPLDQASVGNCVGSPMCPGIEVTWSMRNPPLYATPYRIRHRYGEEHYREHGLSLEDYDETDPHNDPGGCEPGDLTKRMAIPWQADFFQCTFQFINFTEPDQNQDQNNIPIPPTYLAYWWPPQSPMFVISGVMTLQEQDLAGVPAGYQVYYARGINSFTQMITAWYSLGFIINQQTGEYRADYPYFVEKERNHEMFEVASMAMGMASDFSTGDPNSNTFWPVWYLKEEQSKPDPKSALRGVPGVHRDGVPGGHPYPRRIRSAHHGRQHIHEE